MPKTRKPTRQKPRRRKPAPKLPESLKTIWLTGEAEIDLQAGGDETDEPKTPTYRTIVYSGGLMRPRLSGIGYYGRGVVLDLAGWKFQPGQSACNWQHDRTDPVGHIENHQINNRVICEGPLSVPGESREKIVAASRNGYIWRTSVEGSPDETKIEAIQENQIVTVNGRRIKGPFLLLRAGVFTGFGFVTTAGDTSARASIAAELSPIGTDTEMPPTFEEFLEACGVDAGEISAEQTANLQAAFDAQYPDDSDGSGDSGPARSNPKTPQRKPADIKAGNGPARVEAQDDEIDLVASQRSAVAAEQKRISTITRLCALHKSPEITVDGESVDLLAHAIETGMEAQEVELTIYRNSAPRGPAIHSHSGDENSTVHAMTAACLLEAGHKLDSKHFQDPAAIEMGIPKELRAGLNDDSRQKALEAAHAYGTVSHKQLAIDALRADGKPIPRGERALMEAASSSGTLQKVYQASVGASLLLGYREAPATLPMWTGVDEVDDFKEVQRFREDMPEDLAHTPRNGRAEHTTIGADYEAIAVDMFTREQEVGYHDWKDNNLGIINRIPKRMGTAAYRTEEKLGYATLLSNPTMQSTGRALFNSTDGTDYGLKPLTHDNADFAVAALMSQTMGEETLDFEAGFALLPTQLLTKGKQIYQSASIGEDGGDGIKNAIADYGVRAVGSSRLSAGARHPMTKEFQTGSVTTHYLATNSVEVAVRVYQRGTSRAPMVRVSRLTQGRWGYHYDVMHIFGFAFLAALGIIRFRSEA
ncbi:phage major capsid protein [Roseiconus lacunae]|uniref:phage major capsid protein n=1 Tax=Roseiconus lacunae TaxID=2605694 RepID=UPI0011F0C2CB|nr:hypothetical protein [Roseiconus lacunae]